jgi:hypothetical protein
MKITAWIFGWSRRLFWRHYLLWSHRADLFIILMAACFVVSIFGAMLFVRTMTEREASLRQDIMNFRLYTERMPELLEIAKTRPLSQEEEQTILSIPLSMYVDVASERGNSNHLRGLRPNDIQRASDGLITHVLRFVGFSNKIDSALKSLYTYEAPLWAAFLTSVIPLVFMTFFAANVVQIRGTTYPIFSIMVVVLLCIASLPIVTALVSQGVVNSNAEEVLSVARGTALEPWIRLSPSNAFSSIGAFLESVGDGYLMVQMQVIVAFAFICWMAGGAWIIRRLGWNAFLIGPQFPFQSSGQHC